MADAARLARVGPRVAVIEGDITVRRAVKRILEAAGYGVIAVADGENGLRAIHEHQPDLILLDLASRVIDGFEVCRRLRADVRTVILPIIATTCGASADEMIAALDAGADDVLVKPIHHGELLARLRSAYRRRQLVARMDLAHAIVIALANTVEAKDQDLRLHCRHMAYRSARLGAFVGLRGHELEGVAYGALLHDIGKIAVPESLLKKPGPLTDVELITMRTHPEVGERICDPLHVARDIAPIIRHHHERWDGQGYPDRLRGEAIPLGARIVALADAYDAMVRPRPYRLRERTREEAVDEIRRCSGSQFDPGLVPLFIDETDRVESGIAPSVELPAAVLLDHGVSMVQIMPMLVGRPSEPETTATA